MRKKNLLFKSITLAISLFIANLGFSQTCPSGMVSFWNLDDASTVLFVDHTGIHNATSESAVSSTSGVVGTAKHLAGSKYLSAADHNDFDFAANSSFSVECWVKVSSLTEEWSQVIVGKRDESSTGAHWYLGVSNSEGNAIWEVQGSEGVYQSVISPSALSLNSWHHLVGVRNEVTNSNELYIDGALAGSTTYNYTGNFSSAGALMIGAFPDDSGIPAFFLDGDVDEVAIYNRALTLADITEHLQENTTYGVNYCDLYSPVIKSAPVNSAIVGKPYLYTVQATGMPTMSYTLVKGPTGMTIDNATGAISWTPASVNEDAWVEIRANNNVAPADTQKFRIFLAEAPTNSPDNLLLLLKLNENSGPTYADYYIDHTGTATVAPIPSAGIVGGAQTFDATTGIVIPDIANEFEFDFNDPFSIELWMKTSTEDLMVMVGRRRLQEDYPDKARWWLGTNYNGYPVFSLTDNAATPHVVEITEPEPESLADDQWHHIVAVRTSSTMKLYVDGYKVNEVDAAFNGFSMDVETPVSVGYWYPQSASQTLADEFHYIGALDEVAIFNTALTDEQVTSFYNAGAPTGHCIIDNYAPAITSEPLTNATEDAVYNYTFTMDDIDAADVFTMSAETLPTWLSFNYTAGQKSAVLTGTPANENVGEHDVLLHVSDGTVTKDQSFKITVTNVNDAPVITSVAVLTGKVGTAYTYTLTATDVDAGATLTFSAVGALPAGLTFNSTTGILSGTPSQAGTFDLKLRVNDGVVDVDQDFAIVIAPATAIPDIETAGISLYPVPASDHLIIKFNRISEDLDLEVVSITGNVIKKENVRANQQEYRLELNNIEPGAYYIHIRNNSVNSIGKFIIAR